MANTIVTTDVASSVSAPRLLDLIDALAQFGARADGGVDRQALTVADIEARAFLVRHARSLGCTATRDAAGNVFLRRAGTSATAPVATGSHIDTQPAGGKLDGAYGVCAGLEVIAAFNDAALVTQCPVEVVIWANEEGCRFAPGSLGSKVHVEPDLLEPLIATLDSSGKSYAECVAKMGDMLADVPQVPLGAGLGLFIEAHIEQGPVLEARGVPIGIVTGVQGVRWYRVTAHGEAAHAGTTPLRYRRDALRAVAPLLETLYAAAEKVPELRVTIGKIEVRPSSINTVPGDAAITIDVRHVDAPRLDEMEAIIAAYCAKRRHGCDLACESLMALDTTCFDDALADTLRQSANALGLASLDMISGAFHDSVNIARQCPTAMLFVPSCNGISHNPNEHTDSDMLVAGTRVLAHALAQLARPVPR